MYSLIFYFIGRKIVVELWSRVRLDYIETSNAAQDLIPIIDTLLQRNRLGLSDVNRIGLLNGPGSFTSIRIVIATALGLQTGSNIQIYPFRLDQLLSGELCIPIGQQLYYVYTNEWKILRNLDKTYDEIEWNTLGIHIFNQMYQTPQEIKPFM